MVYLTPDDWDPASDGGALRAYAPLGGKAHGDAFVDVQPTAGTLVLFDSARVAHEVLTTHRERMLLAGWLHVEQTS